MTMQDPTKGAGRRLLRVAVIALVVIAVGPVGSALAFPPYSPPTIESPKSGETVSSAEPPTFSGTAEAYDEVGVEIYAGPTISGTPVAVTPRPHLPRR